tara:strand:+ start:2103 stop:2990 length:888 start_codon:yes stop_codon:yes gene_type:complete
MHKLVIAGGTGFLGNKLLDFYKDKYSEIVVLTRGSTQQKGNITYVHWDAKNSGDWVSQLNNASALINLTGKSVDCRFTEKNKELILNSRIDSTLALANAINTVENKPKVWLNASTAALSHTNKEENGDDFMLFVGQEWEKTFFSIENPTVRKIALRISLVFGKEGGALLPLKKITQFGLGGKQGSGKQMVSWIHVDDFVAITNFVLHQKVIKDTIIVASPDAVSNNKLMKGIRKTLNVPFGIPSYAWMLQLGGYAIDTEPDLILNSMDVYPSKLEENGFVFTYNTLELALENLLT